MTAEKKDQPATAQSASHHLLINAVHPEEFRVAIVEGRVLEGFFSETATRGKYLYNIYKGVIAHVQPSLQAAFVNYGAGRNGFLPFGEIHPDYYAKEAAGKARIQDVVRSGREVLVQVVKEEIGQKGAALTSYISLAGRFVVLMPGQNQRGVSRKIEDEAEREELKAIAHDLKLPEGFGVIVRTAAAGRTKRELTKDVDYLMRIWEDIRKRAEESSAPSLIYKERDLAIRVIRDYFTPEIKSVLVDDKDVYRQVKEFVKVISPSQQQSVKLFKEEGPIFAKYHVEEQIERIFMRKVPLKSGGSLVIDQTEALVSIDVNSGRANRQDEVEETVYRVNLEAAAEIPRQMRLRDLGGLLVIDFIDMRDPHHNREVERRFREEAKRDRAKMTVGKISKFGLLELSRQHLGLNIQLGTYHDCPHCHGTGLMRSTEATGLLYLRRMWTALAMKSLSAVRAAFAPPVANYLLNQKRTHILELERHYDVSVTIEADPAMHPDDGRIELTPRETPKEPPKDTAKEPKKDHPKGPKALREPREEEAQPPEGEAEPEEPAIPVAIESPAPDAQAGDEAAPPAPEAPPEAPKPRRRSRSRRGRGKGKAKAADGQAALSAQDEPPAPEPAPEAPPAAEAPPAEGAPAEGEKPKKPRRRSGRGRRRGGKKPGGEPGGEKKEEAGEAPPPPEGEGGE